MTHMNAKNSPALKFGRVKKLDAQNEGLAEKGVFLHPTKGYRRMSLKRVVVGQIAHMLKTGEGRGLSVRDIGVMVSNAG